VKKAAEGKVITSFFSPAAKDAKGVSPPIDRRRRRMTSTRSACALHNRRAAVTRPPSARPRVRQ